ncbi:hypothetical protein P9112_008709 [Eukaryota sp. TZLM1-RC]
MRRLYFNIILGCLSTFMFGYVLSALNIPLIKNRPGFIGADIPELNDSIWKGIVTSAAILGAMISSFTGSRFADKYGRRKTLLWTNCLYISGAIIMSLVSNVYTFAVGRFLAGLGVGVSSTVVPLLMSEISPSSLRGLASVCTQMGVVTGILSGTLVGSLVSKTPHGWRITVGFLVVPAMIQLSFSMVLVESPRWLAAVWVKKDEEMARHKVRNALTKLRNSCVQEEAEAIVTEVGQSQQESCRNSTKLTGCAKPVFFGVFLNIVQQFSGINAIIYYSSEIFASAGFDGREELATVITMLVNVISTIFAVKLVDIVGRKSLLSFGLGGQIVSLSLLVLCPFFVNESEPVYFYFSLFGILFYIASFAIGPGAVLWSIVAEIFPDHARASGVSIALGTNWTCNLIISLGFLKIVEFFDHNLAPVFFLFLLICIAGFVLVLFLIPETKGKSFSEISKLLGLNQELIGENTSLLNNVQDV